MFGIGGPEMALIIVIALVFIGPAKLPEVARTIGKTYRDLKKELDGLKGEFDSSLDEVKAEAFKIANDDSILQIKREMTDANKNLAGLIKEMKPPPLPNLPDIPKNVE